MALKFGSFPTIFTLDIFLIIIASLNECISFEHDACSICKHYNSSPTQLPRACSVGTLKHDVRELKRVLGEALRTYEHKINTRIEEEERNGMYPEYTYQKAFTRDSLSWMQKYDTIHNMLQEICLNMTDMEHVEGFIIMTEFLHSLRTVMCELQAILKLGSFAKEDTHLQITSRRPHVISLNIENTWSTNNGMNLFIRNLLTSRDALDEIADVLK
ncbi:hypothetical protein ACJMK2_005120 [Sinanodonta woodiana]|uniref:Ciliary neurotrophic factor n=1 Tax=Sinanodonta woodiana TaxID=1069815 RepID=A0ABD3VS69_SINWO